MRILLLLAALLFAPVTIAHAEDDLATAQSVITAQVEALGRDDAATAYSYAAPAMPRGRRGRRCTRSTGRVMAA